MEGEGRLDHQINDQLEPRAGIRIGQLGLISPPSTKVSKPAFTPAQLRPPQKHRLLTKRDRFRFSFLEIGSRCRRRVPPVALAWPRHRGPWPVAVLGNANSAGTPLAVLILQRTVCPGPYRRNQSPRPHRGKERSGRKRMLKPIGRSLSTLPALMCGAILAAYTDFLVFIREQAP